MKFLAWYLKIAVLSSMVGGSMELFMIKTGFCDFVSPEFYKRGVHMPTTYVHAGSCTYTVGFVSPELFHRDDKVTVLEAEKRAWENSSEAQAVRDALNPWRQQDSEARKSP